jgi:hypothetical protein
MLFDKQKLPIQKNFTFDTEYINDVIDGSVYQDFIKEENPGHKNDCYTFTLNTDGISLCEKSNLSIWPIYLNLNELDIEDRYFVDHTLIAGKILILNLTNINLKTNNSFIITQKVFLLVIKNL